MRCPACDHQEDKVVDSRAVKEGAAVRRRRECLECGHRFTTYEYVEDNTPLVVKKDGRREVFLREKVLKGLIRACQKRPVGHEMLDRVADDVEAIAAGRPHREIDSRDIGEFLMDRLKVLDEVAYVRFASVYRHFKDVGEFQKEVEELAKTEGGDHEGHSAQGHD